MPARLAAVAWLPLVLVGVVSMAGCQPIGFSQRLVGAWVGVPESAATRRARSPEAISRRDAGDAPAPGRPGSGSGSDSGSAPQPAPLNAGEATDLEAFPVRVTLDLQASGEAAMWLGDDRDAALRGVWRVVAYWQDGATVEMVIPRDGDAEEKRRFAVQMLEGDTAFTLSEEGADRFFGALYFRRQE